MITILSPSKTQDFEKPNRTAIHTQPEFVLDSKELLETLQEKTVEELQEVMQVSERLAFLNYNRFQDIQFPFTPEYDRQAIIAFRGDVYDGLDVDSLTEDDLYFAHGNLRILSGFYGILRPLDLIQPYRLEMGTPLKTKRGNSLYKFWDKFLTDYFNTRYQDDVIINLASKEYSKAIVNRHLKLGVITPVFKEEKNGELRTVAIFAKRARGKMARYIVQNRVKQASKLKNFEEDGYHFDSELSSDTEWVFRRVQPKKIDTKPIKKSKKVASQEEE
ncbi:peroxide stress protein YaaA [Bernardetia sp.]|uniref:peroxide stress protein YaaA n=1 Tax=Bernardetia sp. TaxID=1937974 RepID=UPI0025B8411A|nr:peroxide stress protein YaaA [Bernardetia sp.]